MNNKELLSKLSAKLKLTQSETSVLLAEFIQAATEQLVEGKSISIQGFGTLEVRKKEERLSVNPLTKKRTLIPPKLAVAYKMSSVLKEKIKDIPSHE